MEPVTAVEQADAWGRHFFVCSYCDLSDFAQPRFCPEGERQANKLVRTPEALDYLIHMADEWADEEYHRRRTTNIKAVP